MVMPCFVRRLVENFLLPILLGIVFGFLYIYGKLPASRSFLGGLMGLCVFGMVFISGYMLRSYYFYVKNRFDYFSVNITTYLIFVVVSVLIYKFCSVGIISWKVYTVLFFLYRFFENFKIPPFYSMLMVHGIMLVTIFVAPFEMYHMMDVIRTISKNEDNRNNDK